jgi:Tfp pilus assembly protein PilF
MGAPSNAAQRLGLGALLSLLVVGVYAQVRTHDFVGYDDHLYVTENLVVLHCVTLEGLRRSLFLVSGKLLFVAGNWHPLTLWSHMLDVELYGLWAGGHLLTNVALHLANTLLVFGLFLRWTGSGARSFLVAALFGLHPMHVESVAWVSERKDVLSTLLGLLFLHAWTAWTVRAGLARYALAWTLFALALLAKPMVITLPFVLLLLDVWPLGRGGLPLRRRIVEKVPLLLPVLGSAALTLVAQATGISSLSRISFGARLANALWAWPHYVGTLLWPTGLLPFYPWRDRSDEPLAIAAWAALLAAIFAATWLARRRAPWAWVGWLWFFGMLVPVIGLFQAGAQSMADRYTYLPSVGLFAALVWGGAELLERLRAPRPARAALGAAVVVVAAALAHSQVGIWRSTRTLAERGVEIAPDVYFWHGLLGSCYVEEANYAFDPVVVDSLLAKAEAAYRENVRLEPRDPLGLRRLGDVLTRRGRYEEAKPLLRRSAALAPGEPGTLSQLARLFEALGQLEKAETWARRAIAADPENPDLVQHLGLLLERQERWVEAEAAYRRSFAMLPRAFAACRLGALLRQRSRFDEATPLLEAAIAASGMPPAETRDCELQLEHARQRSAARW